MSLISPNSKIKNKKEGRGKKTYSPAVEECTEYTWQCQTSWVLSVDVFQDFSIYVHGSKLLARQRNVYHLHSTASTFCGGEDDDGLIPVSDEAEDMDAPVWDTGNI